MRDSREREPVASVLKSCLAQVITSHIWFESRILPLSVEQLRWKPRPGGWSVAECLDHLNRTFEYYLPKVEQSMDIGFPELAGPLGSLEVTEAEDNFLQQLEPPVSLKMTAPAVLVPNAAVDPDQIIDQFPHLRQRFEKVIQFGAVLNVLEVAFSDPIHPAVRSLGGVIAMLAAHERRHLWQADAVLGESGFPAPLSLPYPGRRSGGGSVK